MRRYGGTLIHCSRDDLGLIEVVETHGIRSLHFGTDTRQSAMALAEPDRLELPYLRAMLGGLLFGPAPGRMLLLGLGGGSLPRFLLRHCPGCRIDAVELRPAVAAVARRYFGLPEDPRLQVHFADGHDFVCARAETGAGGYDYIHVDLFDEIGLAGAVQRHDFFAACAKLLAADGVLAMNLWGGHAESLRQATRMLNLYFDGGTLRLQVIGRGNVIGFGLGAAVPKASRDALAQRARALEQELGLEFPRLLERLASQRPR